MSARTLVTLATLFGLAIGIGPLPVSEASAQDERPATLSDVRDQGVHYFKRKRYKQARAFLDRAFKMNGGPGDFLTVYYRGRMALQSLLIERAMKMARMAKKLAMKDARRHRSVKEFVDEINDRFGRVDIKQARGETNKRGRIFFESKTGILNKSKRQRFESIRERFRSTDITLPTKVFLPYGKYTANNVGFELVHGQKPPQVGLYLQVDRASAEASGAAGTSNTWMWVGLSVGAAVAAGVGGYFLLSEAPADQVEYHEYMYQNLRGH